MPEARALNTASDWVSDEDTNLLAKAERKSCRHAGLKFSHKHNPGIPLAEGTNNFFFFSLAMGLGRKEPSAAWAAVGVARTRSDPMLGTKAMATAATR